MAADVSKFHFRLVLLGSHGTGKTSILNRFLFKKFETKYKPTVEDLFAKTFDLGSVELKVDFLDTSGSMQFPAMRRLSITTGSAFLIVYAVDDDNSFEVLKMCIAEIQEIRPDFQEIPIVFAGNKCDIPRERRKVLKEVVSNYVHYELPARLRAKVIECSCRDSINIDNLFKAYLSLARVTLCSPVAGPTAAPVCKNNNLQRQMRAQRSSSNTLVAPGAAEQCNDNNNGRSSSIKDALGVRKSCDASILAARKSTHGFPCLIVGATSSQPSCVEQQQQTERQEVMNLERAIQSKLSVSQPSKPRSRSLIWRPANRKSRTSATESSDCRVS